MKTAIKIIALVSLANCASREGWVNTYGGQPLTFEQQMQLEEAELQRAHLRQRSIENLHRLSQSNIYEGAFPSYEKPQNNNTFRNW